MKGWGAEDLCRAQQPASARPASVPLLRWLCSDPVVSEDGRVRSWVNGAGPGYDYPEAGGLWLSFLCGNGHVATCERRQVDAVAAWLADIAERDGGVGRDGMRYLFDSAVVLNGLIDHAEAFCTERHEGAMQRLFVFMADCIRGERACDPPPFADSCHWSLCFGSHQLKTVIALQRYGERFDEPAADVLVERLVAQLTPLFDGRRFAVCACAGTTYQHGSLYALEGLAWLRGRGQGDYGDILQAGADWLAGIQDQDGGLPPFAGPDGNHGAPRADVVAQAARLWTLLDPERYAEPIARALRLLAALQSPAGGVRYEASSGDVNVWVSLFTAQALDWAGNGADVERLF